MESWRIFQRIAVCVHTRVKARSRGGHPRLQMQGWRLEPNSAALMPSSTAHNQLLRVLRHLAAGPKMVQYLRLQAYPEPGSAVLCLCRRSDEWFVCCNCRMRQYGRLRRQDSPTTSTSGRLLSQSRKEPERFDDGSKLTRLRQAESGKNYCGSAG